MQCIVNTILTCNVLLASYGYSNLLILNVLYTLHIYDVEYPPVFRITLTNFH